MRKQPFAYIQSGDVNPPTVTTAAATAIEGTTATCGGTVTSDGGGTVTARGVVWSTSPNPTISLATKTVDGSGLGTFTSNITGLSINTTYYVRAYATNSAGTAYGSSIDFTTDNIPSVTTTAETATGADYVTLGGNVTDDGRGTVTSRGIVWSNSTASPTISLTTKTVTGSGLGTFSATANSLLGDFTYYIRAYATNGAGTGYGNTRSFFIPARQPGLSISMSRPVYNPNIGAPDPTLYDPGGNQTTGQAFALQGIVYVTSNGNNTNTRVNQYGFIVNGTDLGWFSDSYLPLSSGQTTYSTFSITAYVCTPVTLQPYADTTEWGRVYGNTLTVTGVGPDSSPNYPFSC